MTIDEIKAAVDAGKTVHWANEGYIVYKDSIGQYLITFEPNGSTVGLTDRASTTLNGDSQLFFVARPDLGQTVHCQGCGSTDVLRDCWATWCEELQIWEVGDLMDHAFCNACEGETKLIDRAIRDYGAGGPGNDNGKDTPHTARQCRGKAGEKGESKLSEG